MTETTHSERIVQRDDEMWTVKEVNALNVPGARGSRCLICESTSVVRRLWNYPANWMRLSDDDLLNLCSRDSTR